MNLCRKNQLQLEQLTNSYKLLWQRDHPNLTAWNIIAIRSYTIDKTLFEIDNIITNDNKIGFLNYLHDTFQPDSDNCTTGKENHDILIAPNNVIYAKSKFDTTWQEDTSIIFHTMETNKLTLTHYPDASINEITSKIHRLSELFLRLLKRCIKLLDSIKDTELLHSTTLELILNDTLTNMNLSSSSASQFREQLHDLRVLSSKICTNEQLSITLSLLLPSNNHHKLIQFIPVPFYINNTINKISLNKVFLIADHSSVIFSIFNNSCTSKIQYVYPKQCKIQKHPALNCINSLINNFTTLNNCSFIEYYDTSITEIEPNNTVVYTLDKHTSKGSIQIYFPLKSLYKYTKIDYNMQFIFENKQQSPNTQHQPSVDFRIISYDYLGLLVISIITFATLIIIIVTLIYALKNKNTPITRNTASIITHCRRTYCSINFSFRDKNQDQLSTNQPSEEMKNQRNCTYETPTPKNNIYDTPKNSKFIYDVPKTPRPVTSPVTESIYTQMNPLHKEIISR